MTEQTDAYLHDYREVLAGRKPAVIVERRKSPTAYATILATTNGPSVRLLLANSTGRAQPAIIVGHTVTAITAITYLLSERNNYSRADFQIEMGRLLGYSPESCAEYVQSKLSRTCGCQLCGGPTLESLIDDMERADRARTA